jgi:oligopeptide transport system substrate-binding protein
MNRRWSNLLATIAVGFFLAGCESGEETTRTLRIGNHAEPATLDPHRAEGVPERNIQRDLFEGLVRTAADGSLESGVASAWSISDDGLTYRFEIRPTARWSNGDPVTAEDFVFSFRRAVDPATRGIVTETLFPIRNARGIIAGALPPEALGVESPRDGVLEIYLENPTPYFLQLLTHPSTYPVHSESVSQTAEWTRPGMLVSNGAYRLADWRVQSVVTLVKNPQYWDTDNVAIERVQFLPIEDANTELARYAAGEIDITYGIPAGRYADLQERYPEALVRAPWFGTYYLGVNTQHPPLDDARVRLALALAIDRERLAVDIVGSGETAAWHWVPPLPEYMSPQYGWASLSMQERHDLAQQLLEEAALEPETEIEILYNTRDRDQRIVTAVAAMWREALGIETRLRNEEWKVYLGSRQLASTQVFRAGWVGDYSDPNAFLELLRSDHGMNASGWHNAEFDALLDQASGMYSLQDPAKRFALLRQAEELVLQELPVIPLFHYAKARLVRPTVDGYHGHPLDHHYTRHYSWDE